MKLMKIAQISLALIALSVITVNAQPDPLRKKVVAHPMITFVMPDGSEVNFTSPTIRVENVRIEKWMEDLVYLKNETGQVKEWMLDYEYLQPEAQPMTIEDWMTDSAYLEEHALPVENWMTDPEYLKK